MSPGSSSSLFGSVHRDKSYPLRSAPQIGNGYEPANRGLHFAKRRGPRSAQERLELALGTLQKVVGIVKFTSAHLDLRFNQVNFLLIMAREGLVGAGGGHCLPKRC
jgi:hypothetical protein